MGWEPRDRSKKGPKSRGQGTGSYIDDSTPVIPVCQPRVLGVGTINPELWGSFPLEARRLSLGIFQRQQHLSISKHSKVGGLEVCVWAGGEGGSCLPILLALVLFYKFFF